MSGDAPNVFSVYAVEWGSEFPAEIDSLWATAEEARKRCDELNRKSIVKGGGNYDVREWWVYNKWEPESPEQTA